MLCETTTAFARAIAAKAAELPSSFFQADAARGQPQGGRCRAQLHERGCRDGEPRDAARSRITSKGQTYTEVDLNGIADLNSMNESEAENRLARAGFMVTETSFNYLFACILASMATGLPEEFFTGLPLREVLKLKNAVNDSGFFE